MVRRAAASKIGPLVAEMEKDFVQNDFLKLYHGNLLQFGFYWPPTTAKVANFSLFTAQSVVLQTPLE